MEDLRLTYAEAGQRLGVSAEAVRAKAIRRGWRRQNGNDGRTRVLLPVEASTGVEQPVNVRSPYVRKSVDPALMHALEAHNETLKGNVERLEAQLKAAEARADTEADTARKAIAAFASLADRLDALAAERARPWWRRLTG